MMRPVQVSSLWLAAVLSCAFSAVHAQAARSDDAAQRAVQKAQALLRQVAAEKAQLQQQNLDLQTQVKSLEKKLKASEAKLGETSATLEEAQKSNTALSQQLAGTQSRLSTTESHLTDMSEQYRQTAKALKKMTAEKEQLTVDTASTYDAQTNALLECESKNVAMFKANQDLMQKYENKGAWDSLLQRESVTGLKQVEIENVLQEYRFKIEDESYKRPKIDRPESLTREMEQMKSAAAPAAAVAPAAGAKPAEVPKQN